MFSKVISRVRTSPLDSKARKAATKRSRLRSMISVQSLEDRRLLAVLDPIENAVIGTVFEDVNANGFRDPGETGLNGVFVRLDNLDTGASVVAATSDVDLDGNGNIDPSTESGVWQFFNVPLNEVHDVALVTPANAAQTTIDTSLDSVSFLVPNVAVVSAPGQADALGLREVLINSAWNFGLAYEGSIHGFKFEDLNGNGQRELGEPGLANIRFDLTGTDAFGSPVGPITTFSDADGNFEFTKLFPSVDGETNPNGIGSATGYTITEVPQPGIVATTPTQFVTDLLSGQELVWQTGAANLPAPPVLIIDQEQLDDDGAVEISALSGSAQVFRPGITGDLSFVELRLFGPNTAEGNLRLEIQTIDQFGQPSGVVLGQVELTPGEFNGLFVNPGTEEVRFDFSGASLPLLADTEYALVLTSPSIDDEYRWATDSSAPYSRGRALETNDSGVTYTEIDDVDFTFRTEMTPFADPREEVLIGEPLEFGNSVLGSIHGFKFNDVNANGVFNNGTDTPAAGVTFTLSFTDDRNVTFSTLTTTDQNGEFWFTDLAPRVDTDGVGPITGYIVREIVPAGFVPSTPTRFVTDLLSGQELVWRQGAAMLPPAPVAAIDQVQLEADGNGFGSTIVGELGAAQIFQPGITGNLLRVDLRLTEDTGFARLPAAPQPANGLRLEIQTVNPLGEPSGVVIGRADLTAAEVTAMINDTTELDGVAGLVSFNFSTTSLGLLIDTEYALVLTGSQSFGTVYTWALDSSEPYSRGRGFETNDLGATYTELDDADHAFRTVMIPFVDPREEEFIGEPLMFGNTINGSIHGFKFEDINGNAVYEEGFDQPLAGVQFELNGVDALGRAVQQFAVTNAMGQFNFVDVYPSNVTGYSITEQVPVGFLATTNIVVGGLVIGSGEELVWQAGAANLPVNSLRTEVLDDPDQSLRDERLMFGNTVPGSIHGFKFHDLNGNGILEGVELGQAGVTFTLTGTDGLGRTVNRTATTGTDGEFQFVGLFPSDDAGYLLTEVVPTGFVATTGPIARTFVIGSREEFVWTFGAADLPNGDPRLEVLASIDPNANIGDELVFGNVIPGSIHGFKFLDADADGIFDQGVESGLANIPFRLTGTDSSGTAIDTTVVTDADGEFDFVNLLPSIAGEPSAIPGVLQTGYTVTELVPAFFPATTPITFTVDIRSGQEFVAIAGQSTPLLGTQVDVAQVASNSDLTGDFVTALAQTFVPTVTGPLATVVLQFTAAIVVFPVSDILVEVRAIDGGTGLPTGPVLATASISPSDINFGSQTFINFPTPATLQSGDTYAIIVRSETTTTGFSLAASDANPLAGGAALESADGGTTFTEIAGTDLVFATLMTQRINTEVVEGVEQFVGNTIHGSLHGFKFEDVDGNGVFDNAVDVPLGGVVFILSGTLADGTEIVRQAITGADGEFDFTDLPPSVAGVEQATGYTLAEAVPPGFTATTNTQSFFDLLPGQEFVYQAGASDVDPTDPDDPRTEVVDQQGRLVFGNTVPGSIHGFKFVDLNGNGIFEVNLGEFPQEGVEFTLTGVDGSGNVVNQSQFTDETGQFWFVGLIPSIQGTPTGDTLNPTATGYTVTEILPAGFVSSTLPLARQFDLDSRVELVWATGAAMLPAAPAPAVDQVLAVPPASPPGNLAASNLIVALQTFTPGVSGVLTNLQIPLTTTAPVNGDVIVTIRTVNSMGEPTDTVIATASRPGAGLTIGNNVPTNFPLNVNLVAGRQYAFSISAPDTIGLAQVSVLDIGGNPYAGGNAFQANPGDLPGNTLANLDIAFTTTMLAAADPRIEFLADADNNGTGEELIWGNTLPGEIHGFKFNDFDGDGIVDPGEPRLGGFVIQLLNGAGQVVDTETTDANGEYWFVDLRPGTYFVREVQQAGHVQTTHDPQPIVINRGEVYVAVAGQAMLDPDDARQIVIEKCLIFGNTVTASIFGLKFNDLDANGNDNGGTDPRVAGVTITLTGDSDGDGTTDVQTRVTDVNGQFSFQNIRPGTYTLTETPQPGSVATTPVSRTVTLAAGQIAVSVASQAGVLAPVQTLSVRGAELSFGNSYNGEIRGIKFQDINGNGVADPGDNGLAGFTIQLVNPAGTVIATDLTDAQGRYEFLNLVPGTYLVREVQQAGYDQTTHDPQPISITAGQVYVGRNDLVLPNPDDRRDIVVDKCLLFGNTLTSSIYGYKFNDLNADGDDEAGTDPRLAGVTITLTGDSDGDGTTDVQTRITDATGQFSFVNIRPGTYTLTETPPAGSTATTPISRTVTLAAGQIAVALASQVGALAPVQTLSVRGASLTFGNTFPGEFEGLKFQDRDGDGQYEPQSGERGMVDVRFVLSGIDGQGRTINRTAFTGPDGVFRFSNLLPSVAGNPTPVAGVVATGYTITEVVPVGAVATTLPISRTFNLLSGATLSFTQQASTAPGGQNGSLYWGNRLPGEIHGIKFHDLNGDGVLGIGEPTLAGFDIQLINPAGDVVETVTTNAQGEYWFLDVDPGTYFVREVQQRGYFQTTHDPQPISITGGQIYVGRGDLVMQLDDVREIIVDKCLNFGNQLRGEITWEKVNKNGVLLGGVIFELTQTHTYQLATGQLINTPDRVLTVADNLLPDVNNVGGLFQVNDLPLGRYTLRESMPIPGYDPDTRIVTFELYPRLSLDDRFQESPFQFVNTWSKRAYVGSTYAARLAHLEAFAQAEVEIVNGGVAEFFGNPNGGGGNVAAEPFRVAISLAEGLDSIELVHSSSGTVVGEGEFIGQYDVQTTDYDEYLVVGSMPRMTGPLRISVGGGDDLIEIENFNFASIDGGNGRDVLRVRQSGNLSLDSIVNMLNGLEEIDLAGPDQRLSLTSGIARRIGGEQPLRVRTSASDQLGLSESWTLERVLREGADVIQQIRSGSTLVNVINNNRWQNVLNRFDVNGDGTVTALDALVGINQLNGGKELGVDDLPENFFDVNGDGDISALDALQIINQLNSSSRSVGEAISPTVPAPSAWKADPIELASEAAIDALSNDSNVLASFNGSSTLGAPAAMVPSVWDGVWDADDEEEDSTLLLLAGDSGR